MTFNKFAVALLAATSICAPAGAAYAEETVGEVLVTARRTEERAQDVPISMTIFTPQELIRNNITTAGDLSKYTPSLSTSSRFGPDRASFAIRGFVQEANTSPSVGVYFADVVAPRSQNVLAGGNGAAPGTMFDLENIQVLKGPQGTLFGRNTTGGAILLVPRKPEREFGGYVEGSVGNFDMERLQAVVNVPLNDAVRFRAGFDQMRRQGYLDNNAPGIGPKHFADVDYIAGRVSLVMDITPDLENYTIAAFTHSHTYGVLSRVYACQPDPRRRGGAGLFLGDAACAQVARTLSYDDIWNVEGSFAHPVSTTKMFQVINTTTWTINPNLTMRNIMSYGEVRDVYRNTTAGENFFLPSALNLVPGGAPAPTGPLAGTPYGFVTVVPYRNPYVNAQKTLTEELQFRGVVDGDRLVWQAGGYLEHSDPLGPSGQETATLISCADLVSLRCTDILSPFSGGRAVGSVSGRQVEARFRNYGLYAQGTYRLAEELRITGGLRYTWDEHRQTGSQLSYQFPPATGVPPGAVRSFCSNLLVFNTRSPSGQLQPLLTSDPDQCRQSLSTKSNKPTWTIDVEYKPRQEVMLFAKYSRGYRQGLVNLFSFGFETLLPESVDTYEVGAKTTFGGPVPGHFNIVGFWNDLKNQQISAAATARVGSGVSPTNSVLNLGASRLRGVEIEGAIRPVSDLTLSVGYTYLDTMLKSVTLPDLSTNPIFSNFSVTAIVGKPLALSPNHKLVLSADYRLPLADEVGDVSVGGTWSFTSKQITNSASPLGYLKSQDLLNLNLSWSNVYHRPVDLTVFATNVLNRQYPVYIAGSFNSTAYESMTPGEPRMVGVRARYRFGGR